MSGRFGALTLVIALALAGGASARAEDPGFVVSKLYYDYAFQNLLVPAYPRDGIARQPRSVLERYFTPKLAELILRDRACAAREQGVCNLDFDFLFDSQDPSAYDLNIKPAGGEVRVSFRRQNGGREEQITIRCKMLRTKAGWRIDDMIYSDAGSLRRLLSR